MPGAKGCEPSARCWPHSYVKEIFRFPSLSFRRSLGASPSLGADGPRR
jgi:hypothetical protein